MRKDSNEEVELLTESVNVRQIVQRLSCPAPPPGDASVVMASRPKTYTDASDLSGIIGAVAQKKRSSNNNMAEMNSAGLTVA